MTSPSDGEDSVQRAPVVPITATTEAAAIRRRPTAVYDYPDGDGNPVYRVRRWDYIDGDGEKQKAIRQQYYEDGNWVDKLPKADNMPRHIWKLPELFKRVEDPVLLVEGEKTAIAAETMFPEYISTTWMGGCGGKNSVDYSPLAGRDVVCFPDNDTQGFTAMRVVVEHLHQVGARSVRKVMLDPGLPHNWDVASENPIPDDVDFDPIEAVKNAEYAFPAGQIIGVASPIGFDKTFAVMPPEPPALLPHLIPRTVGGAVGAGGSGKSTLELWGMIHCILGRPWLGQEWNDPGPCLYISGEDPVETIRYRIRRICDAMELNDVARHSVAERLFIEDVSGETLRLVQLGDRGNLTPTAHVDDIIDVYQSKNLAWVTLDPAIFFGPGERFINDGESELMRVGRRLSAGLGGCAVRFIHHTGQDAGRQKITDQYAGRGGSAFADNSRGMWVIVQHDSDTDEITRPTSVRPIDVQDGRVIRIHVPKYSIGERYTKPLWIVRQFGDWFDFQYHEAIEPTEAELKEQRNKEDCAMAMKVAEAAHHYLDMLGPTAYPSMNDVVKGMSDQIDGRKVGRDKRTSLLTIAKAKGFIKQLKLPLDEPRHGRKDYVAKGRDPNSVI